MAKHFDSRRAMTRIQKLAAPPTMHDISTKLKTVEHKKQLNNVKGATLLEADVDNAEVSTKAHGTVREKKRSRTVQSLKTPSQTTHSTVQTRAHADQPRHNT